MWELQKEMVDRSRPLQIKRLLFQWRRGLPSHKFYFLNTTSVKLVYRLFKKNINRLKGGLNKIQVKRENTTTSFLQTTGKNCRTMKK